MDLTFWGTILAILITVPVVGIGCYLGIGLVCLEMDKRALTRMECPKCLHKGTLESRGSGKFDGIDLETGAPWGGSYQEYQCVNCRTKWHQENSGPLEEVEELWGEEC